MCRRMNTGVFNIVHRYDHNYIINILDLDAFNAVAMSCVGRIYI